MPAPTAQHQSIFENKNGEEAVTWICKNSSHGSNCIGEGFLEPNNIFKSLKKKQLYENAKVLRLENFRILMS